MPSCPNCSAKVLPDQRVCKACGELLPEGDDSEAPDALLGKTIADKYEIKELLGEGAMGRVYAARQTALDKLIAIKVLHKHLASDPKIARRFHREARAASRLSHPNSLSILDFGEDTDKTLYIAMELLDGDDLLTVIETDSPLSPERIADLLGQVLLALDEAHSSGIIHRDLKPENVVVLEGRAGTEHVKVCDFGIAKIAEVEGGSAITVSGFVCGTPEYMAPEQARGEEIDARADIYAAGCMLYQMLTGVVPFKADSALGIITQHLTRKPVPPRERRPDLRIPQALEDIALRAMEKDRERRYPDALSMRHDLERAIDALGSVAKEPLGTSERDPTENMRLRKATPATGSTAPPVELASTEQALPAVPLRSGSWAWIVLALLAGSGAVAFAFLGGGEDPLAVDDGNGSGGESDAGRTERSDAAGIAPPADDAGAADAGAAAPEDGGAGDAAIDAGRRVRRRDAGPSEVEPPERSRGQIAFDEGRRLFLANDIPGAIRAFEEAARLMPGNASVQKYLGRAYMRSGNVARGVSAYRRYLELAPEAPDRAVIERIIQQSGG